MQFLLARSFHINTLLPTEEATCIPKGGTKNKPVGLVFIGIKYKNKNFIFRKIFKGSRTDIQRKTKEFVFKKINQLI